MFDKHETAVEGVFDQVKLQVGLGAAAFDELMDEGKRESIDDLFDSAVLFANSSAYIQIGLQWFSNDMENAIEVMADGTADQGGTNVDIRILDYG